MSIINAEEDLFLQMYNDRNKDNSFEVGNIQGTFTEHKYNEAGKSLQEKGFILLESCCKKKIGTTEALMFKGKITEEGLKHIK